MWSLEAALVALVAVVALTPVWIRLAPRFGAVDHPRGRHQHERPTPTAGGVVITLSAWLATAVLLRGKLPPAMVGMLLGSVLLAAVNLCDDIRGLPPLARLMAQVIVACVAFTWGVRIEEVTNFGGHFGPEKWIALGPWSLPLTVFWIVFITNGMNWLDGLDGLVAGVAGISALTVAVWATAVVGVVSAPGVGIMAAAVGGSCLGFLRYNFAPARVFMGDTGAMFLGFTLACLSVTGAYKVPTVAAVLLPLLVLGVPVLDSTRTILKRLLSGKSPLEGDRSHIHYRLVDRGLTKVQAVLVIYGLCALLCLCALRLCWQ